MPFNPCNPAPMLPNYLHKYIDERNKFASIRDSEYIDIRFVSSRLPLMVCQVQEAAKRLKAAVVVRLADDSNQQHQPGLLRALQLCEKFINSSAASTAAFEVLKEEVAKALMKQTQTSARTTAAAAKTRKTCATQWCAPSNVPGSGSRGGSGKTMKGELQDQPKPPAAAVMPAKVKQVPAVLLLDVSSPDLPTARLEHKAHLTLNEFDKIVLQQASKARQEDADRAMQRRQRQQQLAAVRAAQVSEVQAQREAMRQAKLQEVQEMDAAVEAAHAADLQERRQHRTKQQRQWELYRQQQLEAEAVKRAAAAAAAREVERERAELAAAEREAAAAAEQRAAAARAKLEAFKAETAAAVEAKKLALAAAQDQERQYVEECKQAMEAAEAKRLAQQEARRAKQRALYEAAGGVSMERRLEQQAQQDAERAARQQAAHEARVAAAEAAKKAAQEAATQQMLRGLGVQLAEKEAARRAAEAAKQAEREAAAAEQQALAAAKLAAKQQRKQQQQQALLQAQQELAAWRLRKFDELNAPMSDADKWVHRKVLQGQDHTFL